MPPLSTLLAFAAMSGLAMSQSDSTITSAASQATASSNDNLIASLWAGGESLLSSYYPSATAIAGLAWPSSVLIGSSTVSVPATTSSPSSSGMTTTSKPQLTSQSANNAVETSNAASTTTPAAIVSTAPHSDKRLGIILGVVLGLVAFMVLGLAVFCLHRRKQRTGTFLRHQPPPNDQEVESWKSPQPSWHGTHSHIWSDKYTPIAGTTPSAMRPAYMNNPTQVSTSTENSNRFYTPNESRAELSAVGSRPTTTEQMPLNNLPQPMSMSRKDRPSTPLIHDMMRSPVSPIDPASQTHSHGYGHIDPYTTTHHSNPFASPEDHYAHGYGQPLHQREPSNPFTSPEDYQHSEALFLPARSPERRNSPHVYYPSGHEISNFDFGLLRDQHGYAAEDGGDGWHSQYTRGGRHEMA